MWQPNVVINADFADILNREKSSLTFWRMVRMKERIVQGLEASGPLVILLTLFPRSTINGVFFWSSLKCDITCKTLIL
uniref:Uncharacterized protein n=1 Tax=Physcomitrium patens TaxID=3218 RepID=A0A2K1K5U3_PHYPA|nr:hypothetical protein PHYPA_011047 [Physcomitrium patens]